jgi:hypothetical protein
MTAENNEFLYNKDNYKGLKYDTFDNAQIACREKQMKYAKENKDKIK